jgi:hypothetical protein
MGRALRPAIACALLAVCLASCGGKQAEAAKARAAYLAEARLRLEAAQAVLGSARDDAGRAKALADMLKIEVMELGDLQAAFKLFGDNESLLAKDLQARVFIAVAQSMQAGREKKIEDKLSWLRKGMRSFDDLVDEYPGNETVLLYQASTYASFPSEVGAVEETLDILASMRGSYESGAWKLESGTAGQLAWIYEALARNNPSGEGARLIRSSREAAERSLPAFAQAVAARGAAAGKKP